MEYLIPAENVESVEKKFKRAIRKGANVSFEVKGYTYKNTEEFNMAKFAIIEASGSYKINGWRFISAIQHEATGNVIRKIVDTEVPERYRTAEPTCEHCHKIRDRKDTYLIQNESGEFKQVGKTCLHDYTNGLDPEVCMAMASFFRDIEKSQEHTGTYTKYLDAKRVKELAYDEIDTNGYTKEGKSTKEKLIDKLNIGLTVKRVIDLKPVDEYVEEQDDSNDFFWNAKIIWRKTIIEYRDLGIICATINSYLRDLQRKYEASGFNYVGEVGSRYTIRVKSVKVLYSKGRYAWNAPETFVNRIIGEDGNIYIWSTSAHLSVGDEIMATIKEYKEYKGEKQNVITRGKIFRPEPEEGTFDMSVLDALYQD